MLLETSTCAVYLNCKKHFLEKKPNAILKIVITCFECKAVTANSEVCFLLQFLSLQI